MRRPYYLIRRGEYWYYRLNRESGLIESDGITWHTTGCKDRRDAENFVKDLLAADRYPNVPAKHLSFRKYAAPFFIWERCPHVRRLREEGKSITRRHATIQRQRLKKHIFKDPFARKRLSEITRADVLDLRSRLLKKNAPATVNKALGIVKVIFREALYREEINRDPTAGVGRVKYHGVERGIFTVEELCTLFPDHGYGPWKDVQDYTCFYLAAVTGLRRGEILALRWRHIDLERQALTVCEAWKGGGEIGPPKWDHLRMVPLSSRTIDKLRQFQMESIRLAPEDFVFAYDDGSRVGETWWRKRFCGALERAEIDRQGRCLTAHSFRHTINTIVRNSGHDPAKIRAILGWMDEAVQENYTHWDLDHLKAWADIVDSIWEG
jgi:integrase